MTKHGAGRYTVDRWDGTAVATIEHTPADSKEWSLTLLSYYSGVGWRPSKRDGHDTMKGAKAAAMDYARTLFVALA
jgi:hypothetical protein